MFYGMWKSQRTQGRHEQDWNAARFKTTPEFWLNLQLTYDVGKAEIERGVGIKAQAQRIAHFA